jgi:BspA type Leucine rich repeat region (6 copies)
MVETIRSSAFENCHQLEEVLISDPVREIESSAFEHCKSLRKVTLPDTLQNLGGRAFWDCPQLKSFHHPAGLVRAGFAIDNSNKLVTVDEHNKVLTYNDGFLVNRQDGNLIQYIQCGRKNLVVPGYIRTVGPMAFSGCHDLETISFANEDVTISNHAFNGCTSLSTVSLPACEIRVANNAFVDCPKAKVIKRTAEGK